MEPRQVCDPGETFLLVKSLVFGIAHSTDWSLCHKATTNGSVKRGKLGSKWEASLSHEAFSNNKPWECGKGKRGQDSIAYKRHRSRQMLREESANVGTRFNFNLI